MSKKMMIVTLLSVLTLSPAYAMDGMKHHESTKTETKASVAQGDIVHVGVDGMVCDFCVQSLKKIFLKEKGVKNIDISLTDKLLTLTLADDTTLDDKKIKELVDYAGYKVTTIHHMPKS